MQHIKKFSQEIKKKAKKKTSSEQTVWGNKNQTWSSEQAEYVPNKKW